MLAAHWIETCFVMTETQCPSSNKPQSHVCVLCGCSFEDSRLGASQGPFSHQLIQPTQPNPTQPNPTQPNPTQPNPTQPNPTQPNPTAWEQCSRVSHWCHLTESVISDVIDINSLSFSDTTDVTSSSSMSHMTRLSLSHCYQWLTWLTSYHCRHWQD